MKYPLYKILYFIYSKATGIRWRFQISFYRIFYKGKISISSDIYGPIPDVIIDSSEAQVFIDKGVSFRGKSYFLAYEGGQIHVGKNVFFNRGCSFNSFSKIHIGNDCLFGERVSIWDHNHQYADRRRLIREQGYHSSPILIGNNCWLGANVIILKGVIIGEGAVIAAGSMVNESVPSFEIWGGIPATKIGTR